MNQLKYTPEAGIDIVCDYAEAYRNLKAAEEAVARVKDAMAELLKAEGPQTFVYADGRPATFTLVEGQRTYPIGYEEAKALTGFGEARMAAIAGPVDPKAVKAMVELGKLGADVADALLPTKSYEQIRAKLGA